MISTIEWRSKTIVSELEDRYVGFAQFELVEERNKQSPGVCRIIIMQWSNIWIIRISERKVWTKKVLRNSGWIFPKSDNRYHTHTNISCVPYERVHHSHPLLRDLFAVWGQKKKKKPQAHLHLLPAKVKVMKSFNQSWNKPRPWKCDLGVGSSLYNIRQFSHNDVIMLMSALPSERIKMNIGNQEFGKQTIRGERLATPSFP